MSDALGVIAARGGSKRVPRKNVREVGGKPLLAYSIEQAASADRVDRAVVSSEDEEIRRTAEEHGGDVPFERPAELATDEATTNEVVGHAIEWFLERGDEFDIVCSIPVTTPFRESGDIDRAIRILQETDAQSVVGVTKFDPPPFWAVTADEDGILHPYFDDEYMWSTTRTQEVPSLLRPNGAIFAATVNAFLEHGSFYTDRTKGCEMPRGRSLDIDEPLDLEIARALMQTRT